MIRLQPNLTEAEIVMLYQHYKDEERLRETQLRRHSLYMEAKNTMNLMKNEIYSQLRKSNRLGS